MLIHRMTFQIKNGCMDEAVRLIKNELEQIGVAGSVQVAEFGPFDDVVLDLSFDNLAAQDAFWSSWWASPESGNFFQQFDQLWAGPGKNEIWNVFERDSPSNGERKPQFINRRTFRVKPGEIYRVVELLQDEQNRADMPVHFRILTGSISAYNQIVIDFEFSSYEEYFSAWSEWGGQEDTPAFFEAWNQAMQPGGTNEIWAVQ